MLRFVTLILIAGAFAAPANAQELTGTLKRVADTGEFRIGYVPDAPPMSYDDEDGNPTGYSIALCRNIARAVKETVGLEEIKLSYVPLISPEDRINAVVNHVVDIECGATTITLSRREQVDFTLMTFITGGAVLSLTGSSINSVADLTEKTVAVIRGTTTHAAIRDYIVNNDFKITLRMISTHTEGMELLNAGKVDGYASDRTMLVGQVVRSEDRSRYSISRDVFSFEPYALMLTRGDTDFRLVADRALASLYGTARIRRLYHDWIGRYGEPMTPILEAMYEFQAVGE
ncbi:MAG: amino acid ABC transporter substrate-binding protein [Proteobacteria bacterium]|nr:amino acid ABC transporter substrate-binding protein [Pseudomonadota bacterium]